MGRVDRSKETTKERVERLVNRGDIPLDAVIYAEGLWLERWQDSMVLPDGDLATVTLSDLYHLIVDSRIWRKSERIEYSLKGIFEMRSAEQDRRIALSRRDEEGKTILGVVVLERDGRVRSVHVVDEKKHMRVRKKGSLIWKL